MTKVLGILVLLFTFCKSHAEPLSLQISAESAILMNGQTGAVLFEKEAHMQRYPASITKIATALYALKVCKNLDEKVCVKQEAIASITPQAKRQSNYRSPAYWLETDGGHVGIKKGEEIPVRDLLYEMLVASANDAANVIAQHFGGGSIPKFMEKVNEYLKTIGCKNTHFLNPHGLHHPQHVTTAYDMAMMSKEAMKDPFFKEIVSTKRYTCPQTNLEEERHLLQTNLLLRNGSYYYPRAIGIKTGTTSAAGKTLVAAAKEGERTLIAVVLGTREQGKRYEDVIAIFDCAFTQSRKRRQVLSAGPQTLSISIRGGKQPLKTYLQGPLAYEFYPCEEPNVQAKVEWDSFSLPIEKDQKVGVVKIIDEHGNTLNEQFLLSMTKIEPTLWHYFKKKVFENRKGKMALFGSGVLFLVIFLFSRRGKRKRSSSSRTF